MEWSTLLAHLEATYREVRTYPGGLVRFTGATGASFGGWLLRAGQGEWLAIGIKVCKVDRLRARAALNANAELPIGALAITGDDVALRQTLPLAGLRGEDLERTVAALAAAAAQLRDPAGPYSQLLR